MRAAERFGTRPSRWLGIRDRAVAADFDVACDSRLRIAEIARSVREAEAIKGNRAHTPPRAVGPSVEITVRGQRRRVRTPEPGFCYDRDGNLVDLRPPNQRGH